MTNLMDDSQTKNSFEALILIKKQFRIGIGLQIFEIQSRKWDWLNSFREEKLVRSLRLKYQPNRTLCLDQTT